MTKLSIVMTKNYDAKMESRKVKIPSVSYVWYNSLWGKKTFWG